MKERNRTFVAVPLDELDRVSGGRGGNPVASVIGKLIGKFINSYDKPEPEFGPKEMVEIMGREIAEDEARWAKEASELAARDAQRNPAPSLPEPQAGPDAPADYTDFGAQNSTESGNSDFLGGNAQPTDALADYNDFGAQNSNGTGNNDFLGGNTQESETPPDYSDFGAQNSSGTGNSDFLGGYGGGDSGGGSDDALV